MTNQQAHSIRKVLSDHEGVRVDGSVISFEGGVMKEEVINSHAEMNRLFESEDYKKGYRKAHEELAEALLWITTASNADLVKRFGRYKRL